MTLQLLLDATIIALLVAFIGYAVVLSRQLRDLRASRDEMALIINSFNEATARAEAGIPRLRKTAEDAGRTLGDAVARARTLRDDLAYMIERAEGTVPRLENALPRQPEAPRLSVAPTKASPAHWLDDDDLVPLPAAQKPTASAARPMSATAMATEARPASGATISRFGPRSTPNVAPVRSAGVRPGSSALRDFDDDRSQAERELLRALRSVR